MTENEYIAVCELNCIDPQIALECDEVLQAIKANSLKSLNEALENNF